VVLATNVNNQMGGSFTGNGAGLTTLNAAAVSSGILDSNRIPNLDASKVASGTLADARLSTNVALLGGTNVFTGTNRFAGVILATNLSNQVSGTFTGNGLALTNLNGTNLQDGTITAAKIGGTLNAAQIPNLDASKIATGTLADARLSANVALLSSNQVFSGAVTFSNAGNSFTGSGAGLTNLNATNLTGSVPSVSLTSVPSGSLTGTVADARLSTNVALRAGGNVFSGSQLVADTIISGGQVLDQQQVTTVGGTGGTEQWQSFTAGTNGFLTAVALQVNSPLSPSPSPGTIRIYAGQGTNGTLLASQSVTWAPVSNTFQTNTLTVPPSLSAGIQYTIRFSAPTSSVGWVDVGNDTYAGGRSDLSSSMDYLFKTFMSPATAGATVLMVNPAGSSGFVGIGTNAPQATLHVAGNILASGTITGTGAGLTGLNASNLSSGSVADARLSANVALLNGTQTFSGANTFSNLGNSFAGNGAGLTNLSLPTNAALRNANQTFTGTNLFSARISLGSTNAPLAVLDLEGGADSSGANDPVAIGLGWHGGGFRHFIRTRHDASAITANNGIDFFLNTNSAAGGSSAPGTGNVLSMTVAPGRVGIGTNAPQQALHVVGNILATGTITGSSDRNVKENFAPVDTQEVLARVAALPITRWNYKADAGAPHLGPMAQDFYSAFRVGADNEHISMVDADGVALAAIQGLNEKTEVRGQRSEDRIQKLEAENAELKARLERIENGMSQKNGGQE
jgi:hypothetical protein